MAVPGAVTNAAAVIGERTAFLSDGATIEAYLARPAARPAAPGIIVVHEAFGPVEHIHDVCRRLANMGFNALAPNLYARDGAPSPNDMPAVLAKMFGLSDDQVVRDLEHAAAALRALDAATRTVGLIGFCSGGRQTLLAACSSDDFDAAVDCWGGFIARATPDAVTTPQRPARVIDLLSRLRCPLYAVFGAEDQNPSPDDARELEHRAALTGRRCDVEVFADAGHAFFADYRPTYREAAAHRLWPKIVAFFDAHLR